MVNKIVLAALILLGLAACGGGGGDGGGPGAPSKLFVLDTFNLAIGSMINPNPMQGIFAVDRIIIGPATGLGTGTGSLNTLPDLVLDAAGDRIYVATRANVLVWDNAGLANGNQPRSRVITSQVTRGTTVFPVDFANLFIDTSNNRLYAAERVGDVHVYSNASSASGLVAPSRSITPNLGTAAIVSTFGVAVDVARDMLYVGVNTDSSRIIVFHTQASLNTTGGSPRAPDRTILLTDLRSLYLDSVNNRLYTAQGGIIRVFDGASTLNGAVVANRTFTLGTSEPDIFVDTSNDRLYAVANNLVFIIPNASTANGPGVTATVVALQVNGAFFSAVATKP